MDIIFVLAVAIFIEKSYSQMLAPSPACYGDGDTLKLECTTADFNQAITFVRDSVSQGGCSVGCAPNFGQSGTITTYTLSSFDSSTHSGNWTCSYGLSVSPEVIIAANLCVETTMGSIEGVETTMGSIEGLETSTTFEHSSVIESTSTPIFVEPNTDVSRISPTDGSLLNTLYILPSSSNFKNLSYSIVTSDRRHTSASFEKDNLGTIDSTNASFFMHTTGSVVPNSLLSSMSLFQTLDTYKTSIQSLIIETITISHLNVTIESGYQSTSSYFDAVSLFSETTIGLLTSGVYMTSPEISPSLIYSALDSSFSATTEVCPTTTFTETISTGMTSTETISTDMASTKAVSTGMTSTETINTDMASTETVSTGIASTEFINTGMKSTETINTDMASTEAVSTGMTSTETVNTDMASTETINTDMASTKARSTGMTSTETINTDMASTEAVSTCMPSIETVSTSTEALSTGITSTGTLSTDMASTETVSTGITSSYKMYDIVSALNETTSIISIADSNVLTRYSLSDDILVLQTTFDSFTTSGSPIHQSVESVIISTAMSIFFTSISGFSSSFTLEAPRSSNTVQTAVEYESQASKVVYKNTSDSQFSSSNSELSGTRRTIIFKSGDLSTTPLSNSSVIDTVKHASNFLTTSSFNENSVSVTQNSFLSSLTIMQTGSIRNNEAESASTEKDSYIPTKLFSSMPDEITKTVTSTYDDKFIPLTATDHILLVTSSLNRLRSFTPGIEDSELITESFVKMISRSSNELALSSSSLDTFSTKYMKTTTAIQHGLSESSKDDIFISAAFGTIGAIILVVLIALVISRYLMQRNKSKDEKYDEISNQLGWSDDGGINSYNKNYISRENPFNSSIHLPLHSYNESPYLSYANYYKKNWDDTT